MLPRLVLQSSQPFGIHVAHPPNVSPQMALRYEVAENRVVQVRRMEVDSQPQRQQRIKQPRGRNHIAQAQRRKKYLVEASEKDNRSRLVQTLERRHWPTVEPILAVVAI